MGSQLFTNEIQYHRLAGLEYCAHHGPLDRLQRVLLNESLTLWEVHREFAANGRAPHLAATPQRCRNA